jgi:hypothetical protein
VRLSPSPDSVSQALQATIRAAALGVTVAHFAILAAQLGVFTAFFGGALWPGSKRRQPPT